MDQISLQKMLYVIEPTDSLYQLLLNIWYSKTPQVLFFHFSLIEKILTAF